MNDKLYEEGYTQNRELSWLRFNKRVMDEAKDESVPLLEKLKFIAIHSSNLNEFFSVRCGSLYESSRVKPDNVDHKSGLTAKEQLSAIYDEARRQYGKRNSLYTKLKTQMEEEGIVDLQYSSCTKEEQKYLKQYFTRVISPILTPSITDIGHPLPVLKQDAVYAVCMVKSKSKNNNSETFAFVKVPDTISDIVVLPAKRGNLIRFVHTEDVIVENLKGLFKDFTISDPIKMCLTRSADVDEETFDDILDYRERMLKVLKKRKKMAIMKIDVSTKPSAKMNRYLIDHFGIKSTYIFESKIPLSMRYAFVIGDMLKPEEQKGLVDEPYTPKLSAAFDYKKPIFEQVRKKDVLLSYPYESMDPFILLIKQASRDPEVISIKITLYRIARNSKLVDYLCQAAENGKDVDVLIELKARFDEQNNIDYSERLEDAGCTVLYGFESYKVHSKICLVTKVHQSKLEEVALIATGNFNEKTAKQYTDLAYMTGRAAIVKDATAFFHNMMTGCLDGKYKNLLVSPVSFKSTMLELIHNEALKGEDGRIIIKCNSVTDEDIIVALAQASQAGVKIDMIIRGICCILPGIVGKTDNIRIVSIVGRYLEHSRVFIFGEGTQEKVYISSADFMTRNTERRVEVATPILDRTLKKKIHAYVDVYLQDNTKIRVMESDGNYEKVHDGKPPFIAQQHFMDTTVASSQELPGSKRRKSISAFKTVYKQK